MLQSMTFPRLSPETPHWMPGSTQVCGTDAQPLDDEEEDELDEEDEDEVATAPPRKDPLELPPVTAATIAAHVLDDDAPPAPTPTSAVREQALATRSEDPSETAARSIGRGPR